MTVAAYLRGCLGAGPMSEMALVAKLLSRGEHEYEQCVILVKNAITDLALAGLIEQVPGHSAYRIPLGTPMEAERERQPISRWRQYKAPTK